MDKPNKYEVICTVRVPNIEAYSFEEAYRKVANMLGLKGLEVVVFSTGSKITESNGSELLE